MLLRYRIYLLMREGQGRRAIVEYLLAAMIAFKSAASEIQIFVPEGFGIWRRLQLTISWLQFR